MKNLPKEIFIQVNTLEDYEIEHDFNDVHEVTFHKEPVSGFHNEKYVHESELFMVREHMKDLNDLRIQDNDKMKALRDENAILRERISSQQSTPTTKQ